MTKMIYTVVRRPKVGRHGLTTIGWAEECGREAIVTGGYLHTRRTLPGEQTYYTAIMTKANFDRWLGDKFETRAQAAFAIWRLYYKNERAKRDQDKANEANGKHARAVGRKHKREHRATPEGQEERRLMLNRKAKEKRDNMTDEQRKAINDKLKKRRAHKKEFG